MMKTGDRVTISTAGFEGLEGTIMCRYGEAEAVLDAWLVKINEDHYVACLDHELEAVCG